jgi:acetyl esterase/lipase
MKRSRRLTGWAVWSALSVAAILLILQLATAFPVAGPLSLIGTIAVPGLLGWILIVSLVLAAVGVLFRRGTHRRAAWSTVVAAGTSAIVAVVLTALFCGAVVNAGGSVDLPRSLVIGSVTEGAPDTVVPYRTVNGRTLGLSVYEAGVENAPIVYYIHGGGWIVGTADQNASDLRHFADAGYLVASVEYRLSDASHATWNEAPEDVACGLAWIAEHAREFGGDPSRIIVAGDSAGGNLALNLALQAADLPTAGAPSGCGANLPAPLGVAVQYPVVDPQDAIDEAAGKTFIGDSTDPRIFTDRYIGGASADYPDRIAAISSATWLTNNAPPMLILSPDSDSLIPPAGVRQFAADAQNLGIEVSLVEIPFSNHATDSVVRNGLPNQARLSITLDFLDGLTNR